MTRDEFEELKTVLVNAAQAAVQMELRGLRSDLQQWLEENRTMHKRLTEAELEIRRLSDRVAALEADRAPDTEPPTFSPG